MKKRGRRLLSALLALALCGGIHFLPAQAEEMIPIVTITADSLKDWTGKQDVREAVLSYRDFSNNVYFTRNITIRPQGTSSLTYEKKNFTVVLDEGVELNERWGSQTKYCLKANYVDPTQACNVVSARLAAEMYRQHGLFEAAPNSGQIDGFPVWVILNGEDAGLYTWNIPKDAWLFGMDSENSDHIVMCAEDWSDACAFLVKDFTVDENWSFEVGEETPENIAKFKRLTTFIASSSDAYFKEHITEYLDLDACLDYYCFVRIAFGADNRAKNMLMVTYDGKIWAPVLYDLDSLWGVGWDGKFSYLRDTSWENMVCGWGALELKLNRCFGEELQARYCELRGGILSTEHILEEYESFMAGIPQGCYNRDRQLWNADGSLIRTLDYMRELMDSYLPGLDAYFGFGEEAEPSAAGILQDGGKAAGVLASAIDAVCGQVEACLARFQEYVGFAGANA